MEIEKNESNSHFQDWKNKMISDSDIECSICWNTASITFPSVDTHHPLQSSGPGTRTVVMACPTVGLFGKASSHRRRYF